MTAALNTSQRQTLGLIRERGNLSRAEIAAILQISRPAVTEIVHVLVAEGWVEEHSTGGNQRGQPKINLQLRARAACSVGVFIQNDGIALMLADLNGRPITTASLTPTPEDPETACDQIAENITRLLRAQRIARERVLSVGVAVTGFFLENRTEIFPPVEMAPWRRFPLQAALAQRLSCTVIVENDGNAAALAEHMNGTGRDYSAFLYLYLAYGVGGGFVHRGEIFTGAFGNACEIGRLIPPHPAVRPTLTSLARRLGRRHGSITGEQISAWFAAGEPKFMDFLARAAESLHGPLATAVVLLDPAAIVLGGKFPPEVLAWLVEHLSVAHTDTARIPHLPQPRVIVSGLPGVEAGLLGAALLPLHAFFRGPSPE